MAPGGSEQQSLADPCTDLVLGIWRLPLKDLEISRDLKSHAAAITAVAALGLCHFLSSPPFPPCNAQLSNVGFTDSCLAASGCYLL